MIQGKSLWFVLILVFLLAFSHVVSAQVSVPVSTEVEVGGDDPSDEDSSASKIEVFVNGTELAFDQPPVLENGRVLVPLRAIFEALEAEVQWDDETRTVTATRGDTEVRLTIGSTTAYKDGEAVELDVPAKIVGGRTLVPLRFVGEALGATMHWDGPSRTVAIESN